MSLDAEHKMIKPGMMEKHVLRQVVASLAPLSTFVNLVDLDFTLFRFFVFLSLFSFYRSHTLAPAPSSHPPGL